MHWVWLGFGVWGEVRLGFNARMSAAAVGGKVDTVELNRISFCMRKNSPEPVPSRSFRTSVLRKFRIRKGTAGGAGQGEVWAPTPREFEFTSCSESITFTIVALLMIRLGASRKRSRDI